MSYFAVERHQQQRTTTIWTMPRRVHLNAVPVERPVLTHIVTLYRLMTGHLPVGMDPRKYDLDVGGFGAASLEGAHCMGRGAAVRLTLSTGKAHRYEVRLFCFTCRAMGVPDCVACGGAGTTPAPELPADAMPGVVLAS